MLFMQTTVCAVLLLSCSLSRAAQDTTPGVTTLTPEQLAAANAAISAAQAKAAYGDELKRRVIAGEAILKREDLTTRPAEVKSAYLYEDNTALQGQIGALNQSNADLQRAMEKQASSDDKELLDMELGLGIGLGGGMALVGAGAAAYFSHRSNTKPTTENALKKLREIRELADSEKMDDVDLEEQRKIRDSIEKTRIKLAKKNIIPFDEYPEQGAWKRHPAPYAHPGQFRRPEGRGQPQRRPMRDRQPEPMEVRGKSMELQPRPNRAPGRARRAQPPRSPRA